MLSEGSLIVDGGLIEFRTLRTNSLQNSSSSDSDAEKDKLAFSNENSGVGFVQASLKISIDMMLDVNVFFHSGKL